MIKNLQILLRPLAARVANMVSRAVVRQTDDAGKLQLLQLGILDGETREGVERVQNYGLTSVPHAGALAAVVFVGGRRDHGLVVAVDDARHRPAGLQPGEVALYTDEFVGVKLRRGQVVEIAGSTDAALKGDSYMSAESAFLDALLVYAAAVAPIADPSGTATAALTTAVTTFKTAGSAALSQKVKLG